MDILVALAVIAIAYLGSFWVIGLIDIGHLGRLVPNGLGWLLVVALLAWLVGDR